MAQRIIAGFHTHREVGDILQRAGGKKYLLVHGSSFASLELADYFRQLKIPRVEFSDFSSNPREESVLCGANVFREEACDAIVAVGGGSALDVAKAIKLCAGTEGPESWEKRNQFRQHIPLIALPTTAGTGSESTHFAVIYRNGEKLSVDQRELLPDYAVLDPSALKNLPDYQKKCAFLDALCQGIESWWSVRATPESQKLSCTAVSELLRWKDAYLLEHTPIGAENALLAANLAGQAIDITQTTAPHAMSYKLTALYGLPHGHAVALCLPKVWRYMLAHSGENERADEGANLQSVFRQITAVETGGQPLTPEFFETMLFQMRIDPPRAKEREKEILYLAESVNPQRLKNNPVFLSKETLVELYNDIIA